MRVVKDPPPSAMYVDPLDSDGAVDRYCHQHRAEIQAQTAVPSRKAGVGIIKFSDWISDDLQDDTKVLLKATMEQPVTASDVDGQIYCFQILSKAFDIHENCLICVLSRQGYAGPRTFQSWPFQQLHQTHRRMEQTVFRP
jgi:hypothetical protein